MSTTPVFVRPALVTHAPYIANLQAQAMGEVLTVEFPGEPLAGTLDPTAMTDTWTQTLAAPPQPGQGVYVATEFDRPVGFVAFTAAIPESGGDTVATEILVLEVQEGARRQGHGSRMLAAVSDLARESRSSHLQVWITPSEEEKLHFYQSAGFAPSGLRRTLDVNGSELEQHLWYAALA